MSPQLAAYVIEFSSKVLEGLPTAKIEICNGKQSGLQIVVRQFSGMSVYRCAHVMTEFDINHSLAGAVQRAQNKARQAVWEINTFLSGPVNR